jgi:hypothetical protein
MHCIKYFLCMLLDLQFERFFCNVLATWRRCARHSHNFRLVRFAYCIQLITGGVSRSLCSTAWSELEKDHLLCPSEDDYMYPKHRCIAMQCAIPWNHDTQILIRNKHQSSQQFVNAKRRIWNNMWICLFESLCWALQTKASLITIQNPVQEYVWWRSTLIKQTNK